MIRGVTMSEQSFLPVLLGSDVNVYGMARSFHEAYGIRSLAVSKTIYTPTVDSSIIDFTLESDLENPECFVGKLIEVKQAHPDTRLLLVPCSDGYIELLVKHREELKKYYEFNCPSLEALETLTRKENFYETCETYGFAYPKTEIITKDNYKTKPLPFDFPVIVKASNSVTYYQCSFPGKKKVFVAQDQAEYDRILAAIYSSEYRDHMTIQEFIPGDDTYMRVLNCYVGRDGKVKLMALGHPLLEDHTPGGIGNYAAIMNTCDMELLDRFRNLLESIGWTGFVNFDMKYDMRDGQYKLFETNPRQGRSSYFVTASGYNLAVWLVDDVIEGKEQPLTIDKAEHLWIQVPKPIVYKYIHDDVLKREVKRLVREGKCTHSLFYKEDLKFSRWAKLQLNQVNHYRKYRKYYGKKGMDD